MSLLSAACLLVQNNSCSWQLLLLLTRKSVTQQGQFCVSLCRFTGTFLQVLLHFALAVFLSLVSAKLMLGRSEATCRTSWQSHPMPFIVLQQFTAVLIQFLGIALHQSCWISHMSNTFKSHLAGENQNKTKTRQQMVYSVALK